VVIVTGATGLVGRYLLPLLVDNGFEVHAVSRHGGPTGGPVQWWKRDLEVPTGVDESRPRRADVVIHTAPLWLLPAWMKTFFDLGVRRLVAFSSTSRITKELSEHGDERDTARRLAEAETDVARVCEATALPWTLFRPTLIYGGGRDRNVTDIARFIEWFGFFPIAGKGGGLRQPVHAEDLARACLVVLDNDATHGQIYELPGGDTLTYAQMVSRIAEGLGRKPRLLHLPPSLMRAALAVARRLGGLSHVTPAAATRMDEDLVFEATRARHDFGYVPRGFRFPDPTR
jgi:nucleoside-diphosphate-sugar epimerase